MLCRALGTCKWPRASADRVCTFRLHLGCMLFPRCLPKYCVPVALCPSFFRRDEKLGIKRDQKLVSTVVLGGWLIHCWLVSWLCVLGTGDGIRNSGQVFLCNYLFFLENEVVNTLLDKSAYSTTLLWVRYLPSMTAMSSFSLCHMNGPEVLFVPPGTRQQWACVCNLLTLENLVFFSILSWAEPFELNAVLRLCLRVRQSITVTVLYLY